VLGLRQVKHIQGKINDDTHKREYHKDHEALKDANCFGPGGQDREPVCESRKRPAINRRGSGVGLLNDWGRPRTQAQPNKKKKDSGQLRLSQLAHARLSPLKSRFGGLEIRGEGHLKRRKSWCKSEKEDGGTEVFPVRVLPRDSSIRVFSMCQSTKKSGEP